MRTVKKRALYAIDKIVAPTVYPSAWLLKSLRKFGFHKLPSCKDALLKAGVFPIIDHYYEPQFDNRSHAEKLSADRNLPGIDWNISGQLQTISAFSYTDEIPSLLESAENRGVPDFRIENGMFESGDAEFFYQLVRHRKPRKIFEIGSGNSTLVAMKAIRKNREEDPAYSCKHVCIEPFEMPWLEKTGISVVRDRVELLPPSYFAELENNDILFIDSSHVIRPFGDVLFEYLELLPSLNVGVIVHIHDIFSPRNYPQEWLLGDIRFWNEQYLLEAFLSNNREWRVLAALNFLQHHYYDELKAVAPLLSPEREPGSFYIQKVS